ncbi:MAG: hypothetical protein F6K04_01380 [Leptolyngbya sp. SIO4C5]|nr:hypothetical protein [Leptolyngbya sp. SIO4C5]
MSKVYRRKPGTKVRYSNRQDYHYLSQRARFDRAVRMKPLRQKPDGEGGYEFHFASQRAPRGYWTVTAKDKPPDGGAGGGGNDPLSQGQGQCSTTYDVTVSFTYGSFSNNRIYKERTGRGTGPVYGVYLKRVFVPSKGDQVIISFASGDVAVYQDAIQGDDTGIADEQIIQIVRVDGQADNCGTPTGGGSSEPPEGHGDYGGEYYYACNCPDLRKQRDRLQIVIYPSDALNRDWSSSNAGALNGPCKHIYAAAIALVDEKVYRSGDTPTGIPAGPPARELPIYNPFYEMERRLNAYYNYLARQYRQRQQAARDAYWTKKMPEIERRRRYWERRNKPLNRNLRNLGYVRQSRSGQWYGSLNGRYDGPDFAERFKKRLDRAGQDLFLEADSELQARFPDFF